MKKKLTKKLAVGMTVVGLGAVGTQTVQQTIQPLVYANTQSDQEIIEELKKRAYNIFNTIYEWDQFHVVRYFDDLFPEFRNESELIGKQSEILESIKNKEVLINRIKGVEEYVLKNNNDDNMSALEKAKRFVIREIMGYGDGIDPTFYEYEYEYSDSVGLNNFNMLLYLENKMNGTVAREDAYLSAKQELEAIRESLRNRLPFIDFVGFDGGELPSGAGGPHAKLLHEIKIVENLTNDKLKTAVHEKIEEWENHVKHYEPISQLLVRADKVVKRSGADSVKPYYVNGYYDWWSLGIKPEAAAKSDQVIAELKPIQLDRQFYDLLGQIAKEQDPTRSQTLQAEAEAMIQFHEDKLNATIETVNRYNQVIDKIMEDPSKSRTLYAKLVFTDYSKYGHFYNAIHLPKATTLQEVAEAKNDILAVLDQFEKEHFGTSSATPEGKVERLIDKANALIIKSGGTLYDIIQDETPFHDGKSPMVAWDTRIQSSQVKAEVRIVKFNQRFEDILAKMTQETDPAVISQLEKEANDILAFEEARLNATTETVEKYNAIMDKLNALPEKERHTAYFKLVFTDFGRYGHIYNAIHLPNVRNLAALPKAKAEILAVLSKFEKQYFGTDTTISPKPLETGKNQPTPPGSKVAPLFQDEKPTLEIVDPSVSTTKTQSEVVNQASQNTVGTVSRDIATQVSENVTTEESEVKSSDRSSDSKKRQGQSRILPKTGETSVLSLFGYVMVAVSALFRVVKKK